MKFGRLIIYAAIIWVVYFFRADILAKIKPLLVHVPLSNEAQKIIGLDDTSKGQISKTQNEKEVLLPGPLAEIIGARNDTTTNVFSYKKIIDETNKERMKMNLKPLTENKTLDGSALFKASDMNQNQYFEHISPKGVGIEHLAKQFEYKYVTIGENLAMGNFDSEEAIVTAWMNSPGHKANILNPKYTEIGVGLIVGTWQGRHVWYAVQHFGKPLSACPFIDINLKSIIEKNQKQINALQTTLDLKRAELQKESQQSPNYNTMVKAYNEIVSMYNVLVNETKTQINTYNGQVRAFNSCSQ